MATLTLAARRLHVAGLRRVCVHHAYLLLALDDGTVYAYSGDKDESELAAPRLLVPYEDLFDRHARDHRGRTVYRSPPLALPGPSDAVRTSFLVTIAAIEARRLTYHPLTRNCNAGVTTLAYRAGVGLPTGSELPRLPGYGVRLL